MILVSVEGVIFEGAKKWVWRKITADNSKALYESMRRRMAALIEAKGQLTKYWCICTNQLRVLLSMNELLLT